MYWNVRGDIDKCLASYEGTQRLDDINIFAFGETHFTEAKQRAYKFPKPGFTAAYATRADGNGGVAVYVHESLRARVLHAHTDPDVVFVSVGEQDILLAMLYAKPARPSEREGLFDILEQELTRLPQHECTLIIGDMNARVADRNRELEQPAGADPGGIRRRSAGVQEGAVRPRTSMDSRLCGRGKRCIDFCNAHQFDIANGCAPGTGSHNFTFHSLGGLGRSVVDLCLVSAHAFHRILDLSIPDHIPDRCTDHCHLVVTAQCKQIRARQSKKKTRRVLWDATGWDRYAREVRNQEDQVQEITRAMHTANTEDLDLTVRSALRFLAGITIRVFGHTLNRPNTQNLKWFDDECQAARDAVRREHERCVTAYPQARSSEILRAITSRYHALMKSKRLDAKAREARDLVRNVAQDPRMFWKWLHGSKPQHIPVHIHTMHIHFCNVLEATSADTSQATAARPGQHMNMPVRNHGGVGTSTLPMTQPHAPPHTPVARRETLGFPISQGEVQIALDMLRNGKSSGDGYIGELLKYAKIYDTEIKAYVYDLAPMCTTILARIFQGEVDMCQSMSRSKLTVIYKGRGDRHSCDSYRGIAIGSALYKLYATVLHNRIDAFCENHRLRAFTQCGFRKGHSTCTALFVLQHAIHSQCLKREGHASQPLYVCFIDFRKAFDKVQRPLLWQRLQQLGIQGRMLEALQHMYQHTELRLTMNGQTHSHCMSTSTGVKQGCPLSPLLFGLFIEQMHQVLVTSCGHLSGIHLGEHNLLDILYADDMVMLSTVLDHLNQISTALEQFCDEQGMEVNVPKSKCVVFKHPRDAGDWPRGVWYKGQQVEELTCFKYMGLPIQSQTWLKDCLRHTSTSASNAMWALINKMTKCDAMPLHIKLQLFDSLVGAIASYGCQVWGVYYLDWRSEHMVFTRNPFQKLVLQFIRIITGAHACTSRWTLLRECNRLPAQVGWAKACAKWWNKAWAADDHCITKTAMMQDITLFRSGCKQCWSALFLKGMASLGLCDTVEHMMQQDNMALGRMVFSDQGIEQAYTSKYETLYWDTHCTEPRNRSGRHAAFIKHHCWFYTDKNPALKLQAADRQVQALTRFRLGTHRLRCNMHTLPQAHRTCMLCEEGRIEDELHLVFECRAYNELRLKDRWAKLYRGQSGQDLKMFMCQDDQYTMSAFICTLLRERQNRLTQLPMHVDLVDPELPQGH